MDMSLNNLWEMVKKRQAWCAAVRGVSELDVTEQLSNNKFPCKEWHQPDCYQIATRSGAFFLLFLLGTLHAQIFMFGGPEWLMTMASLFIDMTGNTHFTTLTNALSCLKVKSLHFSKGLINPDGKHTERHVWILHRHQGKGWTAMLGVEITPEKKTLEINTMQERQLPDREKVGKLSTDSVTLHPPPPPHNLLQIPREFGRDARSALVQKEFSKDIVT